VKKHKIKFSIWGGISIAHSYLYIGDFFAMQDIFHFSLFHFFTFDLRSTSVASRQSSRKHGFALAAPSVHFLFAVQLAWQHAKLFLEALGEIGGGGEAYGIGYLGDCLVGGPQKGVGTLETLLA